ncbi:MAG TPA: hypothetical protein VFL81_01125 [Candidatus Saccharimonadales bacterium]|nr:hypothetical protein [Candidatus Saccharimonadales bacterium]
MKRFSRRAWLPQPSYVVFGLAIGVLLVAIVYGLIGSGRSDADNTSAPRAAVSSPADSTATTAKPEPQSGDKRVGQLKQRIRAFAKAFYDYDSSLSATSQRRAVRSLTTDRFRRETFFGLDGSQGDREIAAGKFAVHGSVKSIWPGEISGQPPTVDLLVTITLTRTDKSGEITGQYDQQVRMTLIKKPATGWLIDSLTQ